MIYSTIPCNSPKNICGSLHSWKTQCPIFPLVVDRIPPLVRGLVLGPVLVILPPLDFQHQRQVVADTRQIVRLISEGLAQVFLWNREPQAIFAGIATIHYTQGSLFQAKAVDCFQIMHGCPAGLFGCASCDLTHPITPCCATGPKTFS